MPLKGEIKPLKILMIFVIIIIFSIAFIIVTKKLSGSSLGLRDMLNQLLCVGC